MLQARLVLLELEDVLAAQAAGRVEEVDVAGLELRQHRRVLGDDRVVDLVDEVAFWSQ